MANNDINIRVKLEGGDGQSTSENVPDTTTSASMPTNDRMRPAKAVAIGAVAVGSAVAVKTAIIDNIGELTDNPELQRNIDHLSSIAGTAIPFLFGAPIGFLAGGARVLATQVNRFLVNRNLQRQVDLRRSSYTRNLWSDSRFRGQG